MIVLIILVLIAIVGFISYNLVGNNYPKTSLKTPIWIGLVYDNPKATDVAALIQCCDSRDFVTIAVRVNSQQHAKFFKKALNRLISNVNDVVKIEVLPKNNIRALWNATNTQQCHMLVLTRKVRPIRGWDSVLAAVKSDILLLKSPEKRYSCIWYGPTKKWKKHLFLNDWIRYAKKQKVEIVSTINPFKTF